MGGSESYKRRLASVFLLPAMLIGQNAALSHDARKLLDKPRLGNVQLTWADGRIANGRILRITDEFIAFETSTRPAICEDLALSEVATVRWLRTPGAVGPAQVGLFWVLLAPLLHRGRHRGSIQAGPTEAAARSSWASSGSSQKGGSRASLEFSDHTVQYRTFIEKRGRWSVEHGLLDVALDGDADSIAPFHFWTAGN